MGLDRERRMRSTTIGSLLVCVAAIATPTAGQTPAAAAAPVRSGAALYYIISGTGLNTVGGNSQAKTPGSLIYEPFGLVHQWGNPGAVPLTFLAFNINPDGVAAVLPGEPAKSQ